MVASSAAVVWGMPPWVEYTYGTVMTTDQCRKVLAKLFHDRIIDGTGSVQTAAQEDTLAALALGKTRRDGTEATTTLHLRRLHNYNWKNCTISSAVLFPVSVHRAPIETRANFFGISIYADGPLAEYVGSDPQPLGTIAQLPPGFLANPENQPYC